MYYVYCHINNFNGKRYIGLTKQTPEIRWGAQGVNYKSSPHFYSAIQKYGWNNFTHKILYSDLTRKQACQKERELIQYYKTQNNKYGYNIMEGGDAPSIPVSVRKTISLKLKGNKNNLGHHCSYEKRNKISKSQKGRKLTEEHKKKLSVAASKRHTPCSEAKRQCLINNYPYKKRVYCQELNKIYSSVQECSRELDIPATNITKLCKGRGKTLKGFHLKYYNE